MDLISTPAPSPIPALAPPAVPVDAETLHRRRSNFFRAERFSQSEISYFPIDFDPGQEYD